MAELKNGGSGLQVLLIIEVFMVLVAPVPCPSHLTIGWIDEDVTLLSEL